MKRTPIRLACILSLSVAAAIASDPIFLARRDYPPTGTGGIAVADANGDGVPDLVGLGPTHEEVTVLFGNGKGTFRQGPTSQTGVYVYYYNPAIADLNADGNIDLVAPGEQTVIGPYGIGVSFGNGDGTFQTAVFYATGTDTSPGNVVVGDFNGDGTPDVAVAASSGLWLFAGKAAGALNPGVLTAITGTAEYNLNQTAAADFNGDGNLDVAVTTSTGFVVLFGNGDGTFQAPQSFTSPSGSYGLYLAAAPLAPGRPPDIVISYATARGGAAPTLAVYRNNGFGSFATPIKADLPTAGSFAIGDVNGDKIPDLVSGAGYIALGIGNGTFQPPIYYPLPSGIYISSVVLADLRNNGRTDVVFQDSGTALSVLLNFGKGRLNDGEWVPVTGGAGCGAAADYNGDGTPDLAVNTPTGVSVLLGTGKSFPAFKPGASIALSPAGCLLTGDLNNDGIPDLLVPSNGIVLAYLGNGDGTFTQASITSTPTGGYLAVGDFNRDGNLDFATSGNLLAFGNGDGAFRTPVPIDPKLVGVFTNIAAGDVNGDGWTDLLLDLGNLPGELSELYVLLNNHRGGFTEHQIHLVNSTGGPLPPDQMVLADLNGDGNLDIVFAFYGGGAFVFLGNGKGGFTFQGILYDSASGTTGSTVGVSDLNGDGIPDIVVSAGATLPVYLGNRAGSFGYPTFYIGAGSSPSDLVFANLHGQPTGFPDIVVPDTSGGVMVLINTTVR